MRDSKPSRHHIRPRSRGGGKRRNLVVLPRGWHSAWHDLFGNLTPEEAMEVITIVMRPDTSWTYEDIDNLIINIRRRER